MSNTLTAEEHIAVQSEERLLSETLIDTCWKSLERATNHFEKLDAKANSLGGFVGVMLTVVLTLSPDVFSGGQFQSGFALLSQLLYCSAAILLAVSLYFCTHALRLRDVKEISAASEIYEMATAMNSSPSVDSEFRYKLSKLIAEVSDNHHTVSQDKKKFLNHASVALMWAVGAIIAAGLSCVTHMTIRTYEPIKQSITKQC